MLSMLLSMTLFFYFVDAAYAICAFILFLPLILPMSFLRHYYELPSLCHAYA